MSDSIRSRDTGGILGGTLLLTLSVLLVKILGVIFKIPLAAYLGDQGMGYFNSAYTVYSFFYLICTAGVPKAVMILEGRAEDGVCSAQRVGVAMKFFALLGTVCTLVLLFFASPLAHFAGSPGARESIILIAPSVIFVAVMGVLRGKLTADRAFTDIAFSQVIEGAGRLLFGLLLARFAISRAMPYKDASALTILGVTVGSALGLLYLLIRYKTSKVKYISRQNAHLSRKERRRVIKEILKISLPITLSAGVMSCSGIIDLSLVMRGLSTLGYSESESVALYGNYTTLAVPMLGLATALISPVALSFVPLFSAYSGKGDTERLKLTVRASVYGVSSIAIPMAFALYFFGEDILSLLFPGSDTSLGAALLRLLSPSALLSGWLLVINSLLEADGMPKAPLYSMALGSLVKLILGAILVNRAEIGIASAPIGTTACYLVALVVSLGTLLAKKRINPSLLASSHAQILASIVATTLTIPLFKFGESRGLGGYFTLLSLGFFGFIYVILTALGLLLSREKRKYIAIYTKRA